MISTQEEKIVKSESRVNETLILLLLISVIVMNNKKISPGINSKISKESILQ